MKIFGYEFRKFEETPTTIVDAVETWCVGWYSVEHCVGMHYGCKKNVQGFVTKESADMFAKELDDARRLLGDRVEKARVYKQTTHTNT